MSASVRTDTVFRTYSDKLNNKYISTKRWSRSNRPVDEQKHFGVTLHYIEEDGGKFVLNDRVLLTRSLDLKLDETKTGEVLYEKLMQFLGDFNFSSMCRRQNSVRHRLGNQHS